MLIENGRLAALPEIATQFRALKNAQSGTSDADRLQRLPDRRRRSWASGRRAGKALGRKLNSPCRWTRR